MPLHPSDDMATVVTHTVEATSPTTKAHALALYKHALAAYRSKDSGAFLARGSHLLTLAGSHLPKGVAVLPTHMHARMDATTALGTSLPT